MQTEIIICVLTIFIESINNLTYSNENVDFLSDSNCYSKDEDKQFRFYGTKTTYKIARESFRNDSFNYSLPGCQPIMLYFVGRHAIRYPDAEDITEMAEALSSIQKNIIQAASQGLTELCESDVQAIGNWKLRMVESDDNRISESGERETREIASNFISYYEELFDLNKADIQVGITKKERTSQTAQAFVDQIFNNNIDQSKEIENYPNKNKYDYSKTIIKNLTIPKVEKSFLYFHDICEELLLNQGVQLGKPKLVKDFRTSQLMQKLFEKVSHRFGLSNQSKKIDFKLLRNIIRACHFEYAIYGHNQAPWCAALKKDELQILEYLDDLEDFHEDAYGRDINSKQTCPLIGDLVRKVKWSMENPDDMMRKTYLHFTHAGVIKRLYSVLGLFNDLDGDGSCSIKSNNNNNHIASQQDAICSSSNRKWRSSLISPFSANFAAVLYKCNSNDNDKSHDNQFKLLNLVQETPVIINGCQSEYCPINQFLTNYGPMESNCNLNEICRI